MNPLARILLLGAATGMRSMTAAAELSAALGDRPIPPRSPTAARLLARPVVGTVLRVAAAGEMVGDKLPVVPDRIEPGPLLGRVAIGAALGAVVASEAGESGSLGALAGGAAALGATVLAFHLRRAVTARAGAPDLPIALAEDWLAVALARLGAEAR